MRHLRKMLNKKAKREIAIEEHLIQYIHHSQMYGIVENTDKIIQQLNAAIVIAEKMKENNCEVEQFRLYKKMFHELWIGIAKHYNYINGIDIDKKDYRTFNTLTN